VARAKLLRHRKWTDEDGNLYEIVLRQVECSTRHPEGVRYRLAFIRSGEKAPALLYDNHHPLRDTIDMLVHARNRMASRRSSGWLRTLPAKRANLEERRNEDREHFHQAVE
jgi:hypothetical protein